MLQELMSREFTPEITVGEHDVKLKSWAYVTDKNNNPSNDYLKMVFNVTNCGRQQEFTKNMFNKDVSHMLKNLKRQFGMAYDTIMPADFLDTLVKLQLDFKFWLQTPIVPTDSGLRTYTNLYFIEPLTTSTVSERKNKTNSDVSDDMETPGNI